MTTHHTDGRWLYNMRHDAYQYIEAGYYEDGVEPPIAKTLSRREALQLVPLLEEDGLIVPRMDNQSRAEDLKIAHRLLDILEEASKHES